ncbi:YaiI/YqxD family protein [Acinetobacter faecalis]|uniref:YaiI/YqxD family protein n=1 Tax=Acinetobacter faecalis TaxID=2665161 RepID=UPI002A91DA5A|nr:YaiI/YqxD family protein [Acinetobacter faecalis]MDY6449714.1 YaiI/YqxD family protein [Acinetobacter faecalis]MDY6456927.1 YaiI/YqxD family protein [Acinetobacter faecalis]MDY6467467.1 YaiI/YqxD family protein [Acinetobacter faecalis]MDY6482001.1 YaiI/YqxD family protein [Acinetobacter faecalis]
MLPFKLWVDADALPRILRDVIIRASDRYQMEVTFVANQSVGITPSVRINSIQVMSGADVADQEIVDRMKEHDIVITQDIPLAAQVIEKGGVAINPRGEVYTISNIKARLHLRDFMDTLRGAGVQTGGPPPLAERDKREFSSSLDQTIQKQKRKTA